MAASLGTPLLLCAGFALVVTLVLLPAQLSRAAEHGEPEYLQKLLVIGTALLALVTGVSALWHDPNGLLPLLAVVVQAALCCLWYLHVTAYLWDDQRSRRSAAQHAALFAVGWVLALGAGLWAGGGTIAGGLLTVLMVAALLPLVLAWVVLAAKCDTLCLRDGLLLAAAPLPLAAGCGLLALGHGGVPVALAFALSLLLLQLYLSSRSGQKDALTGAHTRTWFKANLVERLQDAEENPFVLLMIDLDNFKRINDTWGHLEGDNALVAAVAVLRRSLRRTDLIARFAGDEFLVLANVSNVMEGEIILKRMDTQLSQYNMNSRKPYALGWSVGLVYCDRPREPDAVLAAADAQMYQRKKSREGQPTQRDGRAATRDTRPAQRA